MFIFGVNMPVVEILFVLMILFIIGLIFMIWQMFKMNYHVAVLERMTSDIRNYEMKESEEVKRFELDVKNLESDEAELFLAKTIPTISKIENFIAAELIKGKSPKVILDALAFKGINKDLALRAVNSVTFYLNFYGKLPKKAQNDHIKTVKSMRVAPPKGVKMPSLPSHPKF